MRLIRYLLIGVVFSAAHLAAAQEDRAKNLPEKYQKWLEEEVTYIISEVETEAFLSLTTEAERQSFLDAFWRKRDQNPSTPDNEYREQHYERLAYANEFFGRDTFLPGWKTDRGRYHILLGAPRSRIPHEAKEEMYPAELWFYNEPELKSYGLPPFFYLLFFKRNGSGSFQLYSPLADGPTALLTGYQLPTQDYRDDVERAYNQLRAIAPEVADASISFRTDEGDTAQFSNPAFGTLELLDDVAGVPFYGLDTSYAERLDFERGSVESDYLFTYVPSNGTMTVMPGPGGAHFLHWNIELDAQNISFVRDEDEGVYSTLVIASTEVVPRGDANRLVVDTRQESFMSLTEADAATALRRPFSYSGMTPLIPGSYTARIILRNRACPAREESRCRKSYTLFERGVDVPAWQSHTPELTDIALAYGTEMLSGPPLYRPFRFGNAQILSTASRIYVADDKLVISTGALNISEGSQIRFRVIDLAAPDVVVMDETVALRAPGGPVMPELPLDGFPGGRYELTATLVDGGGGVLDTKTATFTVSPRTSIARAGARGYIPSVRPELPGVIAMSLGDQHAVMGNEEKARGYFERAIQENFQLGPAREKLASMLLDSGEVDRAVELVLPVYQNLPERYEALAILGEAYYLKKDYGKSSELLEKALTLRRPPVGVLNVLAKSHHELGNRDRAVELLERSLSLNPDQETEKALLAQWKASAGAL